MKNNKKATILIYTIILTLISVILGIIVMKNSSTLIFNNNNYLLDIQLINNIKSFTNQTFKIIKTTNSDWSWFIDNHSWSGTNITCRIQVDWNFLVEWNSWTTLSSDWIDDNCNDDNYVYTNSWTLDYPLWFEDNDDYSRLNLVWLITPNTSTNIFWNNEIIEKFIEENINNTWSTRINLWNVENWKLYLNLSNTWTLNIIEYDKEKYTLFREIRKLNNYTGSITGSWYIEQIWNNLSLNSNSGSTDIYNFNFKTNWYIMFINNEEDYYIVYTLSWIDNNKKIFLNPVNDSYNDFIKIMWYNVIINEKWDISSKIKKITRFK